MMSRVPGRRSRGRIIVSGHNLISQAHAIFLSRPCPVPSGMVVNEFFPERFIYLIVP